LATQQDHSTFQDESQEYNFLKVPLFNKDSNRDTMMTDKQHPLKVQKDGSFIEEMSPGREIMIARLKDNSPAML